MKKLFLSLFLLAGMSFGQTTVAPITNPRVQFFNNSVPCAGCLLDTFSAGTTNALATYSESTGTTPNANPVVLGSDGSAVVYLTSASYKFRLRTALGVTLWSQDVISWNTPLTTFAGLTDAGALTQTQPTAATNVANQSSFSDCMNATYWTGAVSATDSWCLQDILGTGTNPASTFTLTHSGSSGASTFSIPGNVSVGGTLTAKTFANVVYADQFAGADAGAKIQAAHDSLPATGGIIDATAFQGTITAAATITLSKPCWLRLGGVFFALSGAPGINITSDDVTISGIKGSPNSNSLGTIIAGNTGTNTVFQTNSFQTTIRDLRITRGVVKTAGAAINITGGGQQTFQNLRIDNTFNGITMTGGGGYFQNINITGSQAMGSGIIIGPVTSGTVTSSTFEAIQINGGTATWSDAYLVLDSGTDGMTFLGCQFVQGTNRSTAVNIRNTSTSNDPEWNKFVGGDVEGGSDHAGYQIDAARGISIASSVIQGLQAILINGGRDIRIANNQIYRSQNEGIKVTAAVPGLNIIGNSFGDNGQATNNTFDDIFINAAATGINIIGNTFGDTAGDAPANKPRNNINIANTGATGFNIVGNNMENSTAVSGFVANSSTTGHWNIDANTPVASITNDLRGALTVGGNFGAAGGKFGTNGSGLITTYNNINTVSGGVPSIVATVDLTNQSAAITATTIYTPAASGMFRISYVAAVTTAATTSSILGGATGLRISYTDPDDSVGKSSPIPGASAAGVNQAFDSYNNQANTTGSQMSGVIVVNAKTGVAIQYLIGYTSVGATAMVYNLHIKVEAL